MKLAPRRTPDRLSAKQMQIFYSLLNRGNFNVSRIARRAGIKVNTAYSLARQVEHPKYSLHRGKKVARNALLRYVKGEPIEKIAGLYNMSESQIKAWAEFTPEKIEKTLGEETLKEITDLIAKRLTRGDVYKSLRIGRLLAMMREGK